MILYLDTSALVKAYVSEPGSDQVAAALTGAEAVATHAIAYVEARAAFARLLRDTVVTETDLTTLKRELDEDWRHYIRVGLNDELIRRAAELAEAFALRAYDSVHLAAADYVRTGSQQSVSFASYDRRLNQAAKVLGLTLLPTTSDG